MTLGGSACVCDAVSKEASHKKQTINAASRMSAMRERSCGLTAPPVHSLSAVVFAVFVKLAISAAKIPNGGVSVAFEHTIDVK